ncbi:alpha/beta fold hydrolase [Sphingomonas ginsenosidivorax]|uniref:Alpha/beta fold hydrolase n=1 Tax=Sphingomonas ginsenosidivorax TaxID=862135 RepID=A0A5C6U857_9SPHN|nr:alpha/beta hydrolase [Sphingomonas ginsenosidivorax]TXC68006.1 alpha/beta fold hydrolase [Sphingomonas ginsenosidivorax]
MSKYHVETTGSGDPILFIHGLGGTSNVFGPQVAALSRFFTCHRFDLPGAGQSESKGKNTIDGLVEAALGVLEQIGVDKPVHVVAHSMGTVVAQHLALMAPDKVRSLTLIGPVHAPGEAGREAMKARAAKAREEGLGEIADQIVAAGTSADTKANQPAIAAFVREFIMRQPAEGYARHCEALATCVAADVGRISVPAILITGDEDNTSPPPAASALAAKFPDSAFYILARTGHWTTIERPKEVNELVLNFLFGVK